jgi:hypothetical protein
MTSTGLVTLDHVRLGTRLILMSLICTLSTQKLNLRPEASKKQVLKALKEHVLASGELVGRYQH